MKKILFKVVAIVLAALSFSSCAKQSETVIPKQLFEVTYVAYSDHDGYSAEYYYNVVHENETKILGNYAYNNIKSLNSMLELSEIQNGLVITFNALDVAEVIVKHKEDVLSSDVIATSENIISRAYSN